MSRRLLERGRRADVARHHREPAGERLTLAKRDAGGERRVGVGAGRGDDRDLGERRAALVGRGRRLHVGVLPRALHRAGRDRLDVGVRAHDGEAGDAGAVCVARGDRRRALDGRAALVGRAHPDQHHALDAAGAADRVGLVASAAEVAVGERAADRAAGRRIEVGEGRRKTALGRGLVEQHGQHRDVERGRRGGAQGDVQAHRIRVTK